MATEDLPPAGYVAPVIVWSVQYADPRQAEEGSFQVASFTTEVVAERFMRRLADDGFSAELRINLIPVHERIEDWEWDR